MAGADITRAKLAPRFAELHDKTVIDVGAGTGGYAALVPLSAPYVGVDFDARKLQQLRLNIPGRAVVQADATCLPVAGKSFDCGIAIALAHHLDDAGLELMLSEMSRILTGRMIFLDPVWNPRSLRGRALWSIDRGAFPRPAEVLLDQIAGRFDVQSVERYAIHHHYLICVATPRS
ncbi:MAG: class I SAM-dependent methyltransferase [Gemmatimonadaceae bacterium]|nr:class I SAM-dependent methyltransferase [Gemmatimonadaceae bacterium]